MIKITIIIPVYNVEKYLREALDNVSNQTLNEIEIICVDDCSTDSSYKILQEYACIDSRIKVLKNDINSGPGIARNKALDIAKGEYILFVDPDDWLDLNACEILYNNAVKNNNDIVLFNYCEYIEKQKQYKKKLHRTKPFENEKDKNHIIIRKCSTNFFIDTYLCFQLYKKELIDKYNIRFSKQRLCEDDIFVVKAFLNSESMSIITKPLYYYRIHKKSLMRTRKLYINVLETKSECYNYVKNFCEFHNTNLPMQYYIDYYIDALEYYFTKISSKSFYDSIKKIFLEIKNDYPQEFLYFVQNQKFFKRVLNNNWYSYTISQLIKNLFYLGNSKDKLHKKLIIFGIKFKIKRNFYKRVKKNYLNDIKNIKLKSENNKKIKVLFLSSEISKWGYDSLYRLFENSSIFEPVVGIFPLSRTISGLDTTQPTLEQQYDFFKQRNINVEYLYEYDYFKDISEIEPDIVFYQQQWDLPHSYRPVQVSEYALTYACSYSYEILNDKENYTKNYHGKIFKYYIEDELNKIRYSKYKGYSDNCEVVGYLKLDKYLNKQEINTQKYWKNPEKFKIIYAPHHSLDESDKDCIFLATFRQNGKFILDYAKSHPETTWIFKPHPRFKYVLEKEHIMTTEEIDKYYREWEDVGTVYDSGDYIDIFKTSDLMLTDCCSFLAEYLPTGKPLIRMINPKGIKLNKLGKKICSQYYISHNNEELKQFLDQLVINKNDTNYSKRQELISSVIDFNQSAAEKIYADIMKTIQE